MVFFPVTFQFRGCTFALLLSSASLSVAVPRISTTCCIIASCDCHPGVCNKLMTVYSARYPLMRISGTLFGPCNTNADNLVILYFEDVTRCNETLLNFF